MKKFQDNKAAPPTKFYPFQVSPFFPPYAEVSTLTYYNCPSLWQASWDTHKRARTNARTLFKSTLTVK